MNDLVGNITNTKKIEAFKWLCGVSRGGFNGSDNATIMVFEIERLSKEIVRLRRATQLSMVDK